MNEMIIIPLFKSVVPFAGDLQFETMYYLTDIDFRPNFADNSWWEPFAVNEYDCCKLSIICLK